MWVDEARIRVVGGRGGDGLLSFHRTRQHPRGRPDGGNGGRGGDVILRATGSVNTLLHLQDQVHFRASPGQAGGPNNRTGKAGKDLVVPVPLGTVVREEGTGEVLADLVRDGDQVVVARGGRGGRGNKAFASPRRQAPYIRELGERGEELWLLLEIRVLADVGIVGFPNVGKSSLLSRVSSKRAKIGAYPFTTLAPNLGVVQVEPGTQFVLADLPGLIEGAHEGKGLGDRFLRHATRARVLLHMVDLAGSEGRDPLEDYRTIRKELASWEELARKPEMVAGNKVDLLSPEAAEEALGRFAREGIELVPISAKTGQGVRELLLKLGQKLQTLEAQPQAVASGPRRRVWKLTPSGPSFEVVEAGEAFEVRGWVPERLARRLDLTTPDAQGYLWERLDKLGVVAALRRRGWTPQRPVRIGGRQFELEE